MPRKSTAPTRTFYISIPNRYRYSDTHPLGLGPDDLVRIEASNNIRARNIANAAFGPSGWCDIIEAGDIDDRARRDFFPGKTYSLDGYPIEEAAARAS